MSPKNITVPWLLALMLVGCFETPIASVGTVVRSGGGGATQKSDSTGGKAVAAVDANSTSDVQLTAPTIEGLQGAQVIVPSGSLGISIDIVVEQAADFSDTSMASEMGLSSDIQIAAATPGLIIRPSENVDLKKPLTLAMPVPLGFGLNLSSGSKYAIIYKYFDPTEQKLLTGFKVVDGTTVKLQYDEKTGKDTIVFEGYFGAYWATILNREVSKEEVPPPKAAGEPIMNKAMVPVIANTGVMKETEVVKVQTVPELVWTKPSVSLSLISRSLVVDAAVPQGQKVDACKIDLFESVTAKLGQTFDVPEGPRFTYIIPDGKAYNLVARFRCRDALARVSVTPWSDVVVVPAVPVPSSTLPTPQPSVPVINTTPGVDFVAAGPVTISGVMAPSWNLFYVTKSAGEGHPSMHPVAIDASGNFKVAVDREEIAAQNLKARIMANPIQKDAAFHEMIAKFYGATLAEATSHIASFADDAAIRAEVVPELEGIIAEGSKGLLIAYQPNPDRRIEADSFKFIGFKTPANNRIFSFSTKKVSGNVRLGLITPGTGDEILTVIDATNFLTETASTVEFMAGMSSSVKAIRNNHRNEFWRGDVYTQFAQNIFLSSMESTAAAAWNFGYKGFGFYMHRDNANALTLGDVCSTAPMVSYSFVSPVTLPFTLGNVNYSGSDFTNANSSVQTNGGSSWCNGPNFYARVGGDHDEVMLQFGTGASFTGQIPSGLFLLKENAMEVARFDFSSFKAVDINSKPKVLVPSLRLVRSASDYTEVKIQFYWWDGMSYMPVSDWNLIRKMVSRPRFELYGSGSSARAESFIWPSSGSELTMSFTSPQPASAFQTLSFEYEIDGHNIRFETRQPI